jgi:hypothetical protein
MAVVFRSSDTGKDRSFPWSAPRFNGSINLDYSQVLDDVPRLQAVLKK